MDGTNNDGKVNTSLYLLLPLFAFLPLGLLGQSGIVSSYSEAVGSEGSVSSSFGQVFFSYPTSSAGSLSEGIQQAYLPEDISIREQENPAMLFVYPNPTRGLLQLDLPDLSAPWRIEVFDLGGRLVGTFPHPAGRSQWTLPPMASGAYLFCFYAGSELVSRTTLFKHH